MPWRCAECGRAEQGRKVVINAVCHHCGKALCREHQRHVLDEAFHGHSGSAPSSAIHCQECRSACHPPLLGGRRRL